MSHSSQDLMPLHFTLRKRWLQQQSVLNMWEHRFRKNIATCCIAGEAGGVSESLGFFRFGLFGYFSLQPVITQDTSDQR